MIISPATGQQTTTLHGVVATWQSGSHAPISKSNLNPLRIVQKVGGATDDRPVIGRLQDEDELLEHAAALMSPIKGLDS